jgi:predicted Ser/Thr protein kinase
MLPLSPSKLGRYEIVEEIGKGAMGVVYLARDPLIGRLVALKTFRIGLSIKDAELEQFRARFIREAQSAGILSHPNIVTIHDVVERAEEGLAFIAMEFVRGTNLKSVLQEPQRPTLTYACEILTQIADGLDYAHSCKVIHRDIKPANILITTDDRAKITDFGIARVDTSNLTQEGQLLGTPNYMSPEQILGRDVDHRADIFSLGVVLYEMVTRHKPFQGENLTVVSHRIVYDAFTPPREYAADLPPGTEQILTKALEKDPGRRYQRARDMADDLRRVLGSVGRRDLLNETQSLSATAALPAHLVRPREARVPGGAGLAAVGAAGGARSGAAVPALAAGGAAAGSALPAASAAGAAAAGAPVAPVAPIASMTPTPVAGGPEALLPAVESISMAAPAAAQSVPPLRPVPAAAPPGPPGAPPPAAPAASYPHSTRPVVLAPDLLPGAPETAGQVVTGVVTGTAPAPAPAPAAPSPPRRRLFAPPSPARLSAAVVAGLTLGLALAGGMAAWKRSQLPAMAAGARADAAQAARVQTLALASEGKRRLDAGDADGAAAAFRAAEQLAPGRRGLRKLREEAEHRQSDTRLRIDQERTIESKLDEGRLALADRRYDEAAAAAQAVLAMSPGNTVAEDILASVKEGRARSHSRAAAATARQPQRGADAASPAVRPDAASRSEQPAAPPAPEVKEATLDLAFFSQLPEGSLLLYVNGRKVLQESFRFYEKAGLFRSRPSTGWVRRSFRLQPGKAEIRLYVTPQGSAAVVRTLSDNFTGGAARRLDVQLGGDRQVSAQLN